MSVELGLFLSLCPLLPHPRTDLEPQLSKAWGTIGKLGSRKEELQKALAQAQARVKAQEELAEEERQKAARAEGRTAELKEELER